MTDIGRAKHKLQFIPPQLRASARVVCDVDVKYFPELIPESNDLIEYNSNNNNNDNSEENMQRLLRNSKRDKRSNQSEHTNSQLQWRGVSRPNYNHAPLHAIRQLATEINDNVPLTDKEFTLFRLAYAECQRHLRGVQVSLLTSSTPIGNVLMMTTQLDAVCSEHDVILSHYFPKLIEFHNYFLAMHEQHVMGAQGVYFELLMEQLCTLLTRASQFVMEYTSFLQAVQEAERQQQTLFHQYDKEDDVCSFNGGNNSVNSSYVDQDEMYATSMWESPSAMSHNLSSVATSAYNTSVPWTSQHERHLPSVIDVTALQEKRALARRIREEQKRCAGQHNTHSGTHAFVSTVTTNNNDNDDIIHKNAIHINVQAHKLGNINTQAPKNYNVNSEPEVAATEYMAVLNNMPFNWACILSRLNAQIALCVSHIDWLVNALTECGLSFNAADFTEDDKLLQLWNTHVGLHKPACTWLEFEPIWLTFPEWCQAAILCILLYGYEKRDDMRRVVVSLYSVNRLLSVLGPLEHLERNLYECAVNNIFSFSLLFDEVQYLFARRSDAKAGDYLVTLTDRPGEVRLIILFETRNAVRVEHSESMNRLNALYLHTLSQQIRRTSLSQMKQFLSENNNRSSNSYNDADKTCANTNKESSIHEKMMAKTSFDTSSNWNQCFNGSKTKKEEDADNDSDNAHRKYSWWNHSSNEEKNLEFSKPQRQTTTDNNNNYNNNSTRGSSADRGNHLFVWFVSSFLQYSVQSSSLINFSNVANVFVSNSSEKAEDVKSNASINAINTLTSMSASSHQEIPSNSWKYNTNRYSLTNEMGKDNNTTLLPIISFANLNNHSIKHINGNRHHDDDDDNSCGKSRGGSAEEDQNRTTRAQPLQLLLLQHRQCSEEWIDAHNETTRSHSQLQSVEPLGYTRKRSYEERVFNSIDDNNSPCTLTPLLTVSHRLLHDSGAWAINGISREEYESIPQVCKTFEEFMLRACGDDLHVDRLLANNMAMVERLERSLRSSSWYMNDVNINNITSSGHYNNKPSSLRAPAKSSSIFSEQHQLQQEQQLGKEAERVRELASSSSLHVACFRNNIRYVRSLLSRGNVALINTPMQDVHIHARVMWTPLLCAINNCAHTDPVEMVCLLLEAGADVLWSDEAHCDALYYAIANGYANTVKVLLEARATNNDNHDNQRKFIQCDDANNNNLTGTESYKDYVNANCNHKKSSNNYYYRECNTINAQWGEDKEGVCTNSKMQTPAVLLALGAHHGLVRDVDIIRFAHVMPNALMMAAIAPSINNYNLIMLGIRIMESKMAGADYTCTLDDKLLLSEQSQNMKTGNMEIRRQDDTSRVESYTLVQREELRSDEEQQHLNNIIANHTAECVRHIRDMHDAIKPLYNRAYYLSWQQWLKKLNTSCKECSNKDHERESDSIT